MEEQLIKTKRALAATLLFAFMLTGSSCSQGDPEAGAWEFKVDTVQSGAGAHATAWLRLVGKEGGEGASRTRAVLLSFDCRPDQVTATIMTEQALRQGSTETRLTVDSNPPLELPAFAGTTTTGGQVVITIPQDSLLALLTGRQRAVIDYADGAGSSKTTAEFSLPGLEVYKSKFQAACASRS